MVPISAGMVILNGKVVTMDGKMTVTEAVATKFGRILAVGSNEDLKPLIGKETKVIDAKGRLVLPGFIDSHNHPYGSAPSYGRPETVWCDAPPNKSIADVLKRIKEQIEKTPKGMWVLCRNYKSGGIIWEEEGRHINRWDIDEVAPENPVQIISGGGHGPNIYNSYALRLAGITKDTPDPTPPAFIGRNPETREPNGYVGDAAEAPLWQLIPPPTHEEKLRALRRCLQKVIEWGITTVHDPGVPTEALALYQELRARNELPVRLCAIISGFDEYKGIVLSQQADVAAMLSSVGIKTGFGDEWIKIIGVKFVLDGALSGRTAAVYEPYLGEKVPEDSPRYKGKLHMPAEAFKEQIVKAHLADLRPCIHAMGDRGIDVALDAIEAALKEKPTVDHRMRIEHATLTTPKQLERMKRLGVHVSSSISFLLGMNWVVLGMERMKWTYALKSLKEYGIVAGGNGDWDVTTGDPLVGIATAVTRKTLTGDILDASQCINVIDAIRLYTTNGAFLAFEEDIKGSLEPGKLADMVILSDDITIPPDDIRDVKVDMTIVGGEVKYERKT